MLSNRLPVERWYFIKRNRTDHQKGEHYNDRDQNGNHPLIQHLKQIQPIPEGKIKRGQHNGVGRDGQPPEIVRRFRPGFHIEAGKTHRSAKGRQSCQQDANNLELVKSKMVHQKSRSHPKRDHITYRIQFHPKIARSIGQSGHKPVYNIEHTCTYNQPCSCYQLTLSHHNDGDKATEKIHQREKTGYDNPWNRFDLAPFESSFLNGIFHSVMICPIMVSPATVVSPTFTLIATFSGTRISILEPNFIIPKRSPATTSSPSFR